MCKALLGSKKIGRSFVVVSAEHKLHRKNSTKSMETHKNCFLEIIDALIKL